MKIVDLLKRESVELNGKVTSKPEAIEKMVALMAAGGNLADVEAYKKGVFAREEESTTGIGEGIAIPHAKTAAVKAPGLAAMVVKDGVDYDSLDGEPAKLIFLIAAPDTEDNVHLEVLSRLSMLLMDPDFRTGLMEAENVDAFFKCIDEAERKRFPEEYETEEKSSENTSDETQVMHTVPEKSGYRVLAVTACPTGIAHTYMAAESLENKAKEMGITIKVETNGSGGAKNVLTAQEIEACDCIIIAADKDVKMARFDGKPVIMTKVANGISKAEELLNEATSGNVKIYHHAGGEDEEGQVADESLGRKIYKSLMNGVSHMLPFVIGGGILIALSFLVDGANAGTSIFLPEEQWVSSGFFGALIAGFVAGYLMLLLKKLLEKLPKSLEGTKPVLLYPFFGILLMGVIMIFLVNPPIGAFNTWLNNCLASMGESSKILLGAVLGGMMSIDFGGPFNKAAYVFGTAAIASGQIDIMAAVMIGGMTPPIGIALSTLLFKNRFTKSEQQTTVTNFIMGMSFITEGAIPFAASDPLRIIPPCVVGSAVAGALSMAFGCGSRAPHGGLFVIGIIENAPMFLVALVIGAVITMAGIVLLKKPLNTEK